MEFCSTLLKLVAQPGTVIKAEVSLDRVEQIKCSIEMGTI